MGREACSNRPAADDGAGREAIRADQSVSSLLVHSKDVRGLRGGLVTDTRSEIATPPVVEPGHLG